MSDEQKWIKVPRWAALWALDNGHRVRMHRGGSHGWLEVVDHRLLHSAIALHISSDVHALLPVEREDIERPIEITEDGGIVPTYGPDNLTEKRALAEPRWALDCQLDRVWAPLTEHDERIGISIVCALKQGRIRLSSKSSRRQAPYAIRR